MGMSKVMSSSFEDKLRELEELVREIESGEAGLNESVEKFSEAKKLTLELEEMLSGAREKLAAEVEETDDLGEEE